MYNLNGLAAKAANCTRMGLANVHIRSVNIDRNIVQPYVHSLLL